MEPHKIFAISGSYGSTKDSILRYIKKLNSVLRDEGFTVEHFTTMAVADSVRDDSIHGLVPDWEIENLPFLLYTIMREQPDILHIHHSAPNYGFSPGFGLLPLILRLRGFTMPIVTTIHAYGQWDWQPEFMPHGMWDYLAQLGEKNGWFDREDLFLLTDSAKVVVTTKKVHQLLVERIPSISDKLIFDHTYSGKKSYREYWNDVRNTYATVYREMLWKQKPQKEVPIPFDHVIPA